MDVPQAIDDERDPSPEGLGTECRSDRIIEVESRRILSLGVIADQGNVVDRENPASYGLALSRTPGLYCRFRPPPRSPSPAVLSGRARPRATKQGMPLPCRWSLSSLPALLRDGPWPVNRAPWRLGGSTMPWSRAPPTGKWVPSWRRLAARSTASRDKWGL